VLTFTPILNGALFTMTDSFNVIVAASADKPKSKQSRSLIVVGASLEQAWLFLSSSYSHWPVLSIGTFDAELP
jgi:hypothetical protein